MDLKFDQFINVIKGVKEIPTSYFDGILMSAIQQNASSLMPKSLRDSLPKPNELVYKGADIADPFNELAVDYVCYVISTMPAFPNLSQNVEGIAAAVTKKQGGAYQILYGDELKFHDVSSNPTGFNLKATIRTIDFDRIDNWFLKYSNPVGEILLMNYLYQIGLKNYIDAGSDWAKQAAETIKTLNYYELFNAEEQENKLAVHILLTVLKVIDGNGPHFQKVWYGWASTIPGMKEEEGVLNIGWLDTCKENFKQDQDFYNLWHEILMASRIPEVYYYDRDEYDGGGLHHCEHYTRLIFGANLAKWLDSSNGPKKYGVRTQTPVKNIVDIDQNSGCITGTTKLLLADGTHKLAKDVEEDDRLMNAQGGYSTVGSELVVNRELRYLYGINDDEPFMSQEHAVLTQRGWCSLSPALSMELVPHIPVKLLRVGDVVLKRKAESPETIPTPTPEKKGVVHWLINLLQRIIQFLYRLVPDRQKEEPTTKSHEEKKPQQLPTIDYEKVVVKNINIHAYRPGQGPVGFGFNIRGGHQSCFANDYCCLITYPEITGQRISSNMLTHMTPAEQLEMEKQVENLSPLLRKALGSSVFDGVKNAFANRQQVAAQAKHTDKQGYHKNLLKSPEHFLLPSMKVLQTTKKKSLFDSSPQMALMNGHLFFDGQPANTHIVGNQVRWERPANGSGTEKGVLNLMPHGLFGTGKVQDDNAESTLTVVISQTFTTSYGPENKPWYEFILDMDSNEYGDIVYRPKLFDPENPDLFGDGSDSMAPDITMKQIDKPNSGFQFQVSIDFSNLAYLGFPWIAAEFALTSDYTRFFGNLYPYDEESKDQNRGKPLELKGVHKDPDQVSDLKSASTQKMLNAPPNITALGTKPLEKMASHFPTAPLMAASPDPDAGDAPKMSSDLGADSLYGISPPNPKAVHSEIFGKLKALMVFALFQKGDEEKLNFLNENDPTVGPDGTLTQDEADLINNNSEIRYFFTDKYATGYLTQSFIQSTDENIKALFDAVPDAKEKLNFFWKGNKATSVVTDKGYNRIMDAVIKDAYTHLIQDFSKYLENGPYWAERLYQYCLDSQNLQDLAKLTPPSAQDPNPRNTLPHICTLLTALDPEKKAPMPDGSKVPYATALYSKVLDLHLSKCVLNGTPGGKKEIEDFLQLLFKHVITSTLQDKNQDWDESLIEGLKKDIKEALSAFEVSSAEELNNKLATLVTESTQLFIDCKDLRTPKMLTKWGESNPKALKLTRGLMGVGLFLFTTVELVSSLMNWDKLDPLDKTQAVVSLIDEFFAGINYGVLKYAAQLSGALQESPELVEGMRAMQLAFNNVSLTSMGGSISSTFEESESGVIGIGRATTSTVLSQGAEEAQNVLTKIAQISETTARTIGIITLGLSAVTTGFRIRDDFEEDQPADVKAIDILQETTISLSILAEGAAVAATFGAFGESAAASVIPGIGPILALVGILITGISLAIPRKAPPTKQEIFVNEQSIPFIKNLA